jgi:uncharacterized protein (DUF427 family)
MTEWFFLMIEKRVASPTVAQIDDSDVTIENAVAGPSRFSDCLAERVPQSPYCPPSNLRASLQQTERAKTTTTKGTSPYWESF